ncbi:MAG: aspartyl protease [Sphingomonadales bacterium]|jgi:aspartyl protease family protein|nr:aspartyl protease [Sphingomonadales bacterium]
MKNWLVLAVVAFALWGGSHRTGTTPLASPEEQKAAYARATDKSIDTVLQRHSDGHFYADVMVNDHVVHFLVDTGASSIALTQDDARTAGVDFNPASFEVVGRGASGDVEGQHVNIHHVAMGQKEAWDLKSVVLKDGLGTSLLGQSFLEQIGSVSINRDEMTLR